MRKFVAPIIVMAGMVLAACSGGASSTSPTSAPLGTVVTTSQATTAPTTAATTAATSQATMAATSAATTAATTAATSQATMAATTAATTAATSAATTAATTGTPVATTASSTGSNGSTTASTSQYVSLNALLKGQISASDNSQVGQVSGVLIQHPVVSAAGSVTPTPAATTAMQSPFVVRYVLVNNAKAASSTSGNVVVVPWQALNLASASTGMSGTTASAGSYTLTVASSVFTAAPNASMTDIQNGTGTWASGVDSYWANQGLTIPATGSTSNSPADNLFLLTNSSDAVKLNDQANAQFGTTSDILVDAATGQIAYFQINGGSNFGNKTFLIPASMVNWNPGTAAAAVNNAGQFVLNFPSTVLNTFPNIDLSKGLDANTINQLNQFWQSIQK